MSASTDKTQLEELLKIVKEKQNKLNFYSETGTDSKIDAQQILFNASAYTGIFSREVELDAETIDIQASQGAFYNGSAIATVVDVDSKQDKLTAGDNITISNDTISADVPVTKYYELWLSTYDLMYYAPTISTGNTYYTFIPSSITVYVYEYTDEGKNEITWDSNQINIKVHDSSGQSVSFNVPIPFYPTFTIPQISTTETPAYIEIEIELSSGIILSKRLYCRRVYDNSIIATNGQLENYATTSDLSNYATTSDINKKQDSLYYYSESTSKGSATIETATGDIELTSVEGDINAETTQGGITLSTGTGKGNITLSTWDGNIYLNSDGGKVYYNGREIATV